MTLTHKRIIVSFVFVNFLLLQVVGYGAIDNEKTFYINISKVNDQGCENLNNKQFKYVIKKAENIFQRNFGIRIKLTTIKEYGLNKYFGQDSLKNYAYQNNLLKYDDVTIKDNLAIALKTLGGNLDKDLLIINKILNAHWNLEKLSSNYIDTVRELKGVELKDGNHLINDESYRTESLAEWFEILKKQNYNNYTLVLTNTFVIDDWLIDPALHSILRGGIIAGFTYRESKCSLVTTFPALNDVDYFKKRQKRIYNQKDKLEIIACFIVHELGHLVLNLSDEYSHNECIMNPSLDVDFLSWSKKVAKHYCNKCRNKISFDATLAKVDDLMKTNSFVEANNVLKKAIEIFPSNSSLLYKQAIIYRKLGKHRESALELENILKYFGNDINIHRTLANLYMFDLKDYAKAAYYYEKLLYEDENERLMYLTVLTYLYLTMENYKNAKLYALDLLKYDPKNAYGYYYLGQANFALEDIEQAKIILNKLINMYPNFEEKNEVMLLLKHIEEMQEEKKAYSGTKRS